MTDIVVFYALPSSARLVFDSLVLFHCYRSVPDSGSARDSNDNFCFQARRNASVRSPLRFLGSVDRSEVSAYFTEYGIRPEVYSAESLYSLHLCSLSRRFAASRKLRHHYATLVDL